MPRTSLPWRNALDVDAVDDLAHGGQHLVAELHFSDAERPAAPRGTEPSEMEAHELPESIEAKTAGHDRVVLEVTTEEPEVRPHVEFRQDMTFAEGAALGPRIEVMRSNISIGGKGSCAFPAPNSSPRPQASNSSWE